MAKTSLHDGLKKTAPEPPDGKIIKGGSVNSDATRKETAPTPGTIGPRTA